MLTLKTLKRIVIFIVGLTVVLVGVALIFLPGPAVVVIPAGIAILSTEFIWARRLLKKMSAMMKSKEFSENVKPVPQVDDEARK